MSYCRSEVFHLISRPTGSWGKFDCNDCNCHSRSRLPCSRLLLAGDGPEHGDMVFWLWKGKSEGCSMPAPGALADRLEFFGAIAGAPG
eukprot:3934689-Rhodomonas_salina.1